MTVAAVAARDGRFLVVEELIAGRTVVNNPAGHLEDGESLLDAVVREVLEETAWDFVPEHLTGVYLWRSPEGRTFLRFGFEGSCTHHHAGRALDPSIAKALWLTRDELAALGPRLRSPLVLRCIDDALRGRRFPLASLAHLRGDGVLP